jgi:hypothetical protein
VARKTGKLPKQLEQEVELERRLIPYVDAFATLHSGRQSGMAANPILLSEIESYCRMYRVYDMDRFIRYIRVMDRSFIEYSAKKAEQDGRRHRHNRHKTRHRRSP